MSNFYETTGIQSFDKVKEKTLKEGQIREDNTVKIPYIIHQTWKDKNVPAEYLNFQNSWQKYLPAWEYRLWTDIENRDFIAEHYDWFLPIYDGYPKTIMRVDAVRYFWMYHFGGLYVDLDFEALKSIEPLLLNQKIVIGLEPNDHLDKEFLQEYGFKHILCNALMASVPKEPFWEFMILQLIKKHKEENPLAATGPFCLTQGYDLFEDKNAITLIPPELLYPINDVKNKSNTSRSVSHDAYGIHHWSGTWWRDFIKKPGLIDDFAAKLRKKFPAVFRVYDKLLKRPNT